MPKKKLFSFKHSIDLSGVLLDCFFALGKRKFGESASEQEKNAIKKFHDELGTNPASFGYVSEDEYELGFFSETRSELSDNVMMDVEYLLETSLEVKVDIAIADEVVIVVGKVE